MNTGSRLREERERLGMNQTEFGAIGGVKKLAQIKYEKGERQPDMAAMAAWAQIGVDVLYVITGQRGGVVAPAEPRMTPEHRALLDNYDACGPEGRDAVRRTASALAQQGVAAGSKRGKKSA